MFMKTNRYKVFSVLAWLLLFSSCESLLDVNDLKNNPNAPTGDQVALKPLTTGTLVGLGTLHEDTDTRIAWIWGGQLHGQSRQHAGFDSYIVSASTFTWASYYNILKNARAMNQNATAVNNKLTIGLSQVIEAMVMLKLTSLWGDVPYSEALDEINHPTPVYDNQLALYDDLIALLDDAIDNLDSELGSIEGDFMYKNKEAKWIAVARTLQARMYLHKKDYTNAIAAANEGIAGSSDDLLMPHGDAQAADINMNFDFFDISRPGDTSFDPPAYLPKFMCTDINTGVETTDVAKRNAKTDETGLYFHYFIYEWETDGRDPNVADGMFVQNAPHPILTYYENQLILAESYARLGGAANIDNAVVALNNVRAGLAVGYINGLQIIDDYINLGLDYQSYLPADFLTGGVANPSTGPNAGKTQQEALLYEIAAQKFIVMIGQYEVFTELRRLQVATPTISLGIPINQGSKYPARFIYPQNEINTNPNVPKISGAVPDQYVKLPIFQ